MGIGEILLSIVIIAVLLIIPALLITAIVLLYKIYKNSENDQPEHISRLVIRLYLCRRRSCGVRRRAANRSG